MTMLQKEEAINAQPDYAAEEKGDPQFPSVETSRLLAAFLLCDLLIGLFFSSMRLVDWLCQETDKLDIRLIETLGSNYDNYDNYDMIM